MIEGLRIWLLGVIAAAFVTAILGGLLPKTAAGTIGKVAGGLIVLLALLRPVGGVEAGRLSGLYDGYASEIDKQIEAYRHSNQTEMAEIIEQETAAYISKKAEAYGVRCQVQVETSLQDGVPVPCAVRLYTQKNSELSQWIERELGIASAEQTWEVAE